MNLQKIIGVSFIVFLLQAVCVMGQSGQKSGEWLSLFNGKDKTGWKINENAGSWQIEDGALICKGERSHIFYIGEQAPFKNFHFKCKVMTQPGANAGIYFHTKFQETGWPHAGFEAQVNNTQSDPKRTGSLYGIVDVLEAPAKDNTWFTEEIIVRENNIKIVVDGKTVVDYTEPKDHKAGSPFTRKLDKGTFAFQAHDPESKVYFKDVMVKKLD
ncbi:MAG: DUF1080 domain-containing protein [Planctomycetota bacterium]